MNGEDILKLIRAAEGIAFTPFHSFKAIASNEKLYYFSDDFFMMIYVRLGCIHTDYYDVKNMKWGWDISTFLQEIVSQEVIKSELKEIYQKIKGRVELENNVLGDKVVEFLASLSLLQKTEVFHGIFSRIDYLMREVDGDQAKSLREIVKS